eukprot:2721240-Rhodomonas_salina.3
MANPESTQIAALNTAFQRDRDVTSPGTACSPRAERPWLRTWFPAGTLALRAQLSSSQSRSHPSSRADLQTDRRQSLKGLGSRFEFSHDVDMMHGQVLAVRNGAVLWPGAGRARSLFKRASDIPLRCKPGCQAEPGCPICSKNSTLPPIEPPNTKKFNVLKHVASLQSGLPLPDLGHALGRQFDA